MREPKSLPHINVGTDKPLRSKPSVIRAGLKAMSMIRRMWDQPVPTRWAEFYRQLIGMEWRPIPKPGKTKRQLAKQRARNQRRRPRALWMSQ